MPILDWIYYNPMISFLVALLVVLLVNFMFVFFIKEPKWILDRLGASDKFQALKFLGLSMGGILFVIQVAISSEVNQNAEQGLRQERLKNAIEHLGNRSDAVRLGGGYELFHLAEDIQELRRTVLDILCAHIRRTTGEEPYREEYKSEPSEEIQSLLTLLFVQKYDVFKSLRIDLQKSWLKGADLAGARLENAVLNNVHLQGAELRGVHLQKAMLGEAQLQGARLEGAQLQGAWLGKAQLQEARLEGAQLQGAWLGEAQLQGARLKGAHLQGASLGRAQLQGARLKGAHLQGAWLWGAHLQKAYLVQAHLQKAMLEEAQLQGAWLGEAQLQGAWLGEAQLQGARLKGAHLQGAWLGGAHLQEAYLVQAHLQGVVSSGGELPNEFAEHKFAERMMEGIGRQSDLSGVVFAGGLERQDVDKIVRGLPEREQMKNLLRRLLKQHVQPASNELPENSGAITEAYTEEEAEQWIAEYEEAMSEVPKPTKGQ